MDILSFYTCVSYTTVFNLATCDLYFVILVVIFTNRISAENLFYEPYRVDRTQDYGHETFK